MQIASIFLLHTSAFFLYNETVSLLYQSKRKCSLLTHDITIITTFVLYIGLMMGIGVYYYRRTRNMSDYFLGNRKLGAWVTSLSAEASDMSGWMLMGVPGLA